MAITSYERRVLTDTISNIDYMLTFFFHAKKEHAEAITTLEKAKAVITATLQAKEG